MTIEQVFALFVEFYNQHGRLMNETELLEHVIGKARAYVIVNALYKFDRHLDEWRKLGDAIETDFGNTSNTTDGYIITVLS